jgi:ribonucleoside-diphosphate reductase alpha chain
MSAQTREASARLIKEKHNEIKKYYPLIASDIVKENLAKDTVEIIFTSGSKIDNLANTQSSKGLRRHRLNMEESALINDLVFQDALEPIPNVPRRTIGKESLINADELSGQIHFLTTAYFKNSEYERSLQMIDEMADLKGMMVLGADWQLACEYGRGETKSQILAKKEKLSPIFFATNYESRWVGSTDNCLVDIDKLMELRVLPKAELKSDGKSEYYIGVDVARSTKTSNNQTSISIGKVKRDKNDRVKYIQLVNLINLPNGMNFTGQAIIIKKLKNTFKAKKVILDGNGLGVGLVDELLKLHIDPITGDELIAYDTINTDHESDEAETDKCLFVVNAQGINSDIIVNFINMVESKTLQLLDKVDQNKIDEFDNDIFKNGQLASVQTEFFIEEVANLQLKTMNGGKLTVERNSKSLDKDRYSSCSYMMYYIMTYENKTKKQSNVNISDLLSYVPPTIRKRRF